VDQHPVAGLQVRSLHQGLPGGQGDKGHRGRLGHGEVGGLDREIVLVHGEALGEGADAAVAPSPLDLVAHPAAGHGRPDADHDTGEVVAEEEWRLVGEEQLERPVAELGVKQVHAGRVDADQHVAVAGSATSPSCIGHLYLLTR
jgi:hypothetical protein